MVWLQDSILGHLHHHTHSGMFSNNIFETHCDWILFWPKGMCLVYSSTNLHKLLTSFSSFFHNTSNTTWIVPFINCRYPSMCVHTSHWPYGYPPLMLCSWQWAHKDPWCSSQHLCCRCMGCWFPHGVRTTTCVSFKHVQLLLLMNQHYAH
jgi:hypothetical protein